MRSAAVKNLSVLEYKKPAQAGTVSDWADMQSAQARMELAVEQAE